jgi:hypothetical protein
MKRKLLILFFCAPLLAAWNNKYDKKPGKESHSGFINITVESNVNKLFFKYELKSLCITVTDRVKTSTVLDTSVSIIRVPVKEFRSTNLFVYKEFLELLKAEAYPYLEIGIPQTPASLYQTDGSVVLKGISVTVAGLSRYYDINCTVDRIDNDTRFLNGILRIKLTDLEIEPPVKWSGLVRVRNEIIVKFGICINNFFESKVKT